jgi:hypothetical protein
VRCLRSSHEPVDNAHRVGNVGSAMCKMDKFTHHGPVKYRISEFLLHVKSEFGFFYHRGDHRLAAGKSEKFQCLAYIASLRHEDAF